MPKAHVQQPPAAVGMFTGREGEEGLVSVHNSKKERSKLLALGISGHATLTSELKRAWTAKKTSKQQRNGATKPFTLVI